MTDDALHELAAATAPGHTNLPVTERVRNDDDGSLDEVVTAGPAHLERIDRRRWFLALYRADGSSLAVWLHGDVVLTEERGSL